MSTSLAHKDPDHSELMDSIYRHQRYIYDATRKYYLLGRDRMIRGLAMSPRESLLEIGCGTGRNLAVAAKRYPDIRLYGLDISQEMLASAEKTLLCLGRAEPKLKLGDAAQLQAGDFGVSGFDRIMISYALSMIPEWEKTIEAALGALKPGGSLHIADFGQQRRLPVWFRYGLRNWLKRFHVTPRAELETVLRTAAANGPYALEFHSHARDYAWIAVIRRKMTV
jgi:S-adenosylmethionine-diacylgycerolhomoserine-N-methlytransferase